MMKGWLYHRVLRRFFIQSAALVLLPAPLSALAEADRPNIVLILSDDQGYGDLGAHGNTMIRTPHLDGLHGESVRFTNFHVDPTCSPTRAALLTGRYSTRAGVWHTVMGRSILFPGEVTLAEVLAANGYRNGIGGGRDIAQLTAHLDLLPTLAELCGLDFTPRNPLDGRSLVPLLRNPGAAWPERTLFVHTQREEIPPKWRASSIMTQRWRLVKGVELYDLEDDPGQARDVAARHPGVVQRLRAEYETWWSSLEPSFTGYGHIVVGAEENPTHINCMDWHAPTVRETLTDEPGGASRGAFYIEISQATPPTSERPGVRPGLAPVGNGAGPVPASESEATRASNPTRFQLAVQEFNQLECDDCDGVALGDISGNGKVDLLLSNGKGGETFWYEQGATPHEWTRHHIFTIPSPEREIEGNDLGDFNGDGWLEAVSLDQRNGVIYLHAHHGDARAEWKTAAIQSGRPLLQASMATDLDGDGRPELVYTWEGREEGSGGVHWLQFVGTNLLDPAHWRDRVLVQHESAWWIAPRRADLNGNGRATDLVFTARNLKTRNPAARPGVFWLEEPEDVTRPWTRHAIDDTLNHPLHVDLGDLSGHGHGLDVVVGGFDTQHVYWYSFSDGWERHALPLPELDGAWPDQVWNVKTARFRGERDGVLTPVTRGRRGALIFYEFTGERHEPNLLRHLDYGHPMDDRILLFDLDGDGLEEALIPDSGAGISRFVWIKFRWGR